MHKEKNYTYKVYILNFQDIENLLSNEVAFLMEIVIKVDQTQKIFDQDQGNCIKDEHIKIHL